MQENEAIILQSLETYRPVAIRAAIIFFIMDSLPALDRVYLFSMAAFVMVSVIGVWMWLDHGR